MLAYTQGSTIVLDQEMYNRLMSTSNTMDIDPFTINTIGGKYIDGKTLSLFKVIMI